MRRTSDGLTFREYHTAGDSWWKQSRRSATDGAGKRPEWLLTCLTLAHHTSRCCVSHDLLAQVMTLSWEEEGQQEKLQLYDVQPDGSGRLDWAAAEKAFDADTVKIEGRGLPGVFPSGERQGLTRDIFQPGSVLPVTVTPKQGKTQATGQSSVKQALLQFAFNAIGLPQRRQQQSLQSDCIPSSMGM